MHHDDPGAGAPMEPPQASGMTLAQRQALRFAGVIAAYLLLLLSALWIVWSVRGLLPPFFAAFIMAITLAPPVDRLEARGWPRGLATGVVYLGLFAAIGGLLFVLVPVVSGEIGQIVLDLRAKFPTTPGGGTLGETVARQIRILGRAYEVPSFLLAPVLEQAKNSAALLTRGLESFSTFLLGLVPNLIWLVLVPLVAFYGIVDYHRIFAKLLLLTPRQSRDEVRGIASEVTVVFSKYLRGLGLICLLNTLATIAVLLLFPATRSYAAALGSIAGILYAVPYLGAICSTALIALVALSSPEGGGVAMMLWVTLAMVALHQLFFDQVLAPRILGGHVGLHPILSILALMAGSTLLGIGGMLLAVPVAASLQIVVLHLVPRLRKQIDVKMQTDAPESNNEENARETQALLQGDMNALARGRVRVVAGDGIVGPVPTAGTMSGEASAAADAPPRPA